MVHILLADEKPKPPPEDEPKPSDDEPPGYRDDISPRQKGLWE